MLTSDRRDGVRVITIDRPSRSNALRTAELEAIESTVKTAGETVLYLTGSEGVFSAGADLAEIHGLDAERAGAFARRGQATARSIESADSVVIAGIEGPARGGGVELALACDIRVATPSATFAETGVGIGLFGAWGGTHRLPAVVGLGNALELSLSGRVIDAQAALRMGLVSRIVDDPFAVAASIAEHDGEVLRAIKRLIRSNRRPASCERAEAETFSRLVERRSTD